MKINNTLSPAGNDSTELIFGGFNADKNLAQYVDSMLFDSGTVIAGIEAMILSGLTIAVSLTVCGSVAVTYKGMAYHKPSEFPEDLRKQIAARAEASDPCAPETEDYDVTLNNWFEYVYEVQDAAGDIVRSDGILCEDDIHTMTEDQLRSEMEEVVRQVLELV